MKTCLECGNSDMQVRVVDGAAIHECGLCGARFGDRRAVEALSDADEAKLRSVDAKVWPLVRTLDRLPGLRVRSSAGGDLTLRTLPFVELVATSNLALIQLENLAKALRLGAGALQRHWVLEVEYQQHLAFVLKPHHPGGAVSEAEIRGAHQDLEVLWRQIDRDRRLGWWRHAVDPSSG